MEKTIDTDNQSRLAYVELEDIATSSTNAMFREPEDMMPPALQDLCGSITQKGVIQPILLRPAPANHACKYIIVAGERRFEASRLVAKAFPERTTIPAYIRHDLTEAEALELQIIENLQRENINPIKEARGFAYLVKEKKFNTATIAAKIGKSMDYVQERIRLTQLSAKGQDLVASGVLPLKAALLICRVPENLQQKALEQCTTTIDSEKGRTTVFRGLDALRHHLDYSVFNDLDKVAFDRDDPKLVPSAGGCGPCQKRTHNTGGLFDDVSKGDRCLDGGCFRSKLTAHYKKIQEEAKKKHPEAEVIFKARDYSATSLKQLGPIQNSYEGFEITEAQAKTDKSAKLAVLVGDGGGKKTVWVSSRRPGEKKADPAKPKTAAQKAAELKAKEAEAKSGVLQAFQDYYQLEALFKRTPTQLRDLLRSAVLGYAQNCSNEDETLSSLFLFLDVPFQMQSNYMANAKVLKIEGSLQERIVRLAEGNGNGLIKDPEKLVDKIPVDNLIHAFAWLCMCDNFNSSDAWKAAGLDKKPIHKKAQEATEKWWKEKKAQPPAAAGKKGGKKK